MSYHPRRLRAHALPAELVFALGFALGSIATGFFRAIGSDLYKKAKEKLMNRFKNRDLSLRFEMTHKGTKILIVSETYNEEQLSNVFDTIDKARNIAIDRIEEEKAATMKKIVVSYNNKTDKWETKIQY